MGYGDEARFSPEDVRDQARKLVKDAGDFGERIEKARQGFRSAAVDEAPWFSAGGWGMFKQPAKAASEADGFVSQVMGDMESMGDDLDAMVRDLANVDVNSGTELDELGKVVNPR
ncbi:MAG: hypothetical protein ACRD0P_33785 [Stackebrandtia sp.]